MTQRMRRILFRIGSIAIITCVIGLLISGAVIFAAVVLRALDDGGAASPSAWDRK